METSTILVESDIPTTASKGRGPSVKRIGVIGNYLPRQCGIATFTTDLCDALVNEYEDLTVLALPVNDRQEGYAYPARVRFEMAQDDVTSYRRAADFLNLNSVDLVCLQHEYGIFGGEAGSHILTLLRELRMPVVATLHTVLKDPDEHQRSVLEEVGQLCDRLVVMSHRGRQFLEEIYNVPAAKIDMIHHGIPDVPFVDPAFYKDNFGVEGQNVILTFGLLSPNKGVEQIIKAMPRIVERYPNTTFICLGATHPHLVRHEGERYREGLEHLARELGVAERVQFVNQFVELEHLLEYIGAADIYITPYLNQAQITSGTLAYAAGAGKAVISTPYWYAEELLADGRGVLVPFKDSDAIASTTLELLENSQQRNAMRKRAYVYGRAMTWSTTARRYMRAFIRAREERSRQPRAAYVGGGLSQRAHDLPMLKVDHLRRLTDDTGIMQHAIFTVPNYTEGY
ncbi:MAG: glycosyltransferase family 4 protein, partial [Phycisphaerae bacterium]|nr:glycosyltransferase family 4 protein [Phycisphaerae bacterium]